MKTIFKDSNPSPIAISTDAFFFEKDKSQSVLVMGVGNYLMGDEGIGVHVVQEMATMELPDSLDLLDGGTGGLLLLSSFEAYPAVIFIDATMDGKDVGTVSTIQPKFASDFPQALSVHDVGLKDMIESVYLMDDVPEIHLITISIKEIKPMTLALSHPVRKAIPKVMQSVLKIFDGISTMNEPR